MTDCELGWWFEAPASAEDAQKAIQAGCWNGRCLLDNSSILEVVGVEQGVWRSRLSGKIEAAKVLPSQEIKLTFEEGCQFVVSRRKENLPPAHDGDLAEIIQE